MWLRIDDSRPPVDLAAGYKTNARTAINYVRDRNTTDWHKVWHGPGGAVAEDK